MEVLKFASAIEKETMRFPIYVSQVTMSVDLHKNDIIKI